MTRRSKRITSGTVIISEASSEGEDKEFSTPIIAVPKKQRRRKSDWEFDFSPETPLKEMISDSTISHISFDSCYCDKLIPFDSLNIHKKKLAEVEAWFDKFTSRSTSAILILSGPSGSGKSTCLKSILEKYNVQPFDAYSYQQQSSTKNITKKNLSFKSTAFPTLKFTKEVNSNSSENDDQEEELNLHTSKAIIFEDLPNPDAVNLLEIILEDSKEIPLQIILVVTDPCDHQSISDDILFRRISKLPVTTHIRFNPIAPTLAKKIFNQKFVTNAKATDIGDGDVRGSLLNHIFESLIVNSTSLCYNRDLSVNIFHSVGKILHPSNNEERRNIDEISSITDHNRQLAHSFLHANYLRFISDLEETCKISDSFSWLDTIQFNVINDHLWNPSFSCLPEVMISYCVNNHQRTMNNSSRFISINAPTLQHF